MRVLLICRILKRSEIVKERKAIYNNGFVFFTENNKTDKNIVTINTALKKKAVKTIIIILMQLIVILVIPEFRRLKQRIGEPAVRR